MRDFVKSRERVYECHLSDFVPVKYGHIGYTLYDHGDISKLVRKNQYGRMSFLVRIYKYGHMSDLVHIYKSL